MTEVFVLALELFNFVTLATSFMLSEPPISQRQKRHGRVANSKFPFN